MQCNMSIISSLPSCKREKKNETYFLNYLDILHFRGNESLKTIHSNIESNMGMLAKACSLVEKDFISCKQIELSIKQGKPTTTKIVEFLIVRDA